MDISTLYKTLPPAAPPRDRSAVTPVKPPQDRKRQGRRRDRKAAYDEDVVVTLSGRAPGNDPADG